jgi:metal-responsive CopG/Arc/MetJ family transcriptional regulator
MKKLKEGNMARVLISMSDEFLNKVDSIANTEQRTRSELIREALRSYLRKSKMSNIKNAEENAATLSSLLED